MNPCPILVAKFNCKLCLLSNSMTQVGQSYIFNDYQIIFKGVNFFMGHPVATFEHANRATLRFAVSNRSYASLGSSQTNSRNVSFERQASMVASRTLQCKCANNIEVSERLAIWNKEAIRMLGEDSTFTWSSLMALLDPEWSNRLKEDLGLKEKKNLMKTSLLRGGVTKKKWEKM